MERQANIRSIGTGTKFTIWYSVKNTVPLSKLVKIQSFDKVKHKQLNIKLI